MVKAVRPVIVSNVLPCLQMIGRIAYHVREGESKNERKERARKGKKKEDQEITIETISHEPA